MPLFYKWEWRSSGQPGHLQPEHTEIPTYHNLSSEMRELATSHPLSIFYTNIERMDTEPRVL